MKEDIREGRECIIGLSLFYYYKQQIYKQYKYYSDVLKNYI